MSGDSLLTLGVIGFPVAFMCVAMATTCHYGGRVVWGVLAAVSIVVALVLIPIGGSRVTRDDKLRNARGRETCLAAHHQWLEPGPAEGVGRCLISGND